jgi:hypothetical protein
MAINDDTQQKPDFSHAKHPKQIITPKKTAVLSTGKNTECALIGLTDLLQLLA